MLLLHFSKFWTFPGWHALCLASSSPCPEWRPPWLHDIWCHNLLPHLLQCPRAQGVQLCYIRTLVLNPHTLLLLQPEAVADLPFHGVEVLTAFLKCDDHPWAISFFSTQHDMRFFFSLRYDIRASKKTFFLRNFQRIIGIFGVVAVVMLRTLGSWVFRIFGEFLESFPRKRTKKITGFENIEIHDMGGSIRYTLR